MWHTWHAVIGWAAVLFACAAVVTGAILGHAAYVAEKNPVEDEPNEHC